MKYFESFGEWLADNYISNYINEQFITLLEYAGLGKFIALMISAMITYYVMIAFWECIKNKPPKKLENIDVNDIKQVKECFKDFGVVSFIAYEIGELSAESLEEFHQQLKTYNIYKWAFWKEVNLDDEDVLVELLQKKLFISKISDYLNREEPETVHDLKVLLSEMIENIPSKRY